MSAFGPKPTFDKLAANGSFEPNAEHEQQQIKCLYGAITITDWDS